MRVLEWMKQSAQSFKRWLLIYISSRLSIEDFAIKVEVNPDNISGGYIFLFDRNVSEGEMRMLHGYLSSFMENLGIGDDRYMVIHTELNKTSMISFQ